MITQFHLTLQIPEDLRTNNIGSILHGFLMELLPSDVVEILHQQSAYNPLKQRIMLRRDVAIWEVVSFSEFVSESLALSLHQCRSINLKHHDVKVPVLKVEQSTYQVNQLIDEFFMEDNEPKRFVNIQIMTPMSFKSQGRYDIFPDVRKFFRSIMLQFDAFFESYKMHDHDTLDYIMKQVTIVDYRLRSTRYHLEGVKIPSFIGAMTLRLSGPDHFKRLLLFLIHIGSFTGSGIKTSLGMGKYKVL